jgi:pimeloyl-ACP methyl ester carboxylesterase
MWTSITTYVKDLSRVVDQIEGPVFLIGHSMGGFTVQHYLTHPAKHVVGATLLCSAPSHGLWHLMGKLIMHYPLYFIQSVLEMSWLPVMKNRKRLKRVMFRNDFQEQQMAPVMSKLQDESFLAFLEMVFLRLPKIKRFPVPVLVVGAEKDYLISVNDTQRMARHYGVDALIVKDASHCLMLESGFEMVAEKIKSFAHQH